jgi:uncharacterized Fe-S cluster protein YjdI
MKPHRVYSNGEINVEWRPPLCVHCKACLEGLPKVFDLSRRPWVDMEAATSQEIRDTVALCPDGALSVVELKK